MKNIIIFGTTQVAIEICKYLKLRGIEFLLVDIDNSMTKEIEKNGFEILLMDYTDDEILKELGIGKDVDIIFSLFDEDYKNVYLSLSVRSLDPLIEIVAVTHYHDSIHKLKAAGANTIIDPYHISGKKFYEVIKTPEIVSVLDELIFQENKLAISEIRVLAKSKLDGMYLQALNDETPNDILFLGIHDKELSSDFLFLTEGLDHKIDAEDILVVVGESYYVKEFKKEFNTPLTEN